MRCKGRSGGCAERMRPACTVRRLAERPLKIDSLGGIARLTVALIYDFRPTAENSTPAACAPRIHPSGKFFPEPQSAQTKKQI